MAEKFEVGDIVQLQSGGPRMTVKGPSVLGDEVECQWFAGSKLQSGYFKPDSLRKVDDSEFIEG